VLHGTDCWVDDIVTDSRRRAFGAGAMFVAMRGANHDSHDYVAEMYRSGVRAFMVERIEEATGEAGYVCVDNAIAALQRLAQAHRAAFKGTVVGITGSNGKTVVKEWTARALPSDVKLIASPMSYNSQLGVALSLLMIQGDEDVALIEAGISEVGEMERLERMIRPDVVVVTSIGDAHQANFESVEQKIEEKLQLARRANRVVYHSSYPLLARAVEALPVEAIDAAAEQGDEEHGEVQRINSQLVKALCRAIGYDDVTLEKMEVAMRLEVKEGIEGSTIINDSYNSDINSLALALDTLSRVALGSKKVAVVSDILQSGMGDEELYGRVAAMVHHAEVDLFIGVGERISSYADKFKCNKRFYDSTEQLMRSLTSEDIANRTILLKGN
jgi:alanine racemase